MLIFQKMLMPQIVFGTNQKFPPKLSHRILSALMDFVQAQSLLCSLSLTYQEVKTFDSPICAMTLSLKAQNVPRKLVELLQGNLKKARFSFEHLIQAFSVNINEPIQQLWHRKTQSTHLSLCPGMDHFRNWGIHTISQSLISETSQLFLRGMTGT